MLEIGLPEWTDGALRHAFGVTFSWQIISDSDHEF